MIVPILLFHSVSEVPSPGLRPFTVTPATFLRQLEIVVQSGVTVLTVSDFVDRRAEGSLPERPAVISFDDGFADFADHALPALAAHRLPASLYVTTGFLEGGAAPRAAARPADPFLRWSQLPELASAGIEIGAHTHTHPWLDTLPVPQAREEIVRSKDLLESALGREVRSFAYPNGYSSAAVRGLVREAGFASACAVRNAFSSETDDVLRLARLTVRDTTTTQELAGWLAGTGAPAARSSERIATRAWRVYRRTRAVASGVPGSDFR